MLLFRLGLFIINRRGFLCHSQSHAGSSAVSSWRHKGSSGGPSKPLSEKKREEYGTGATSLGHHVGR